MSNSIWHKYDIKDIPNPHHEILAWTGTKHAVVIIKPAEWRSGDCDWIESWAYIQDVLAQADKAERLAEENEAMREEFEVWHGNYMCVVEDKERLQKAVDLALNVMGGLKSALTHTGHTGVAEALAADINEIKQLIKE